MSATTSESVATFADLAQHEGKAELIAGRIVPLMPTGYRPSLVAFRLARSLDDHARATGRGVVFADNMGFTVSELASGRESFSPDAAYYEGPPPADEMDFVAGAPQFAIEVRSKNDYGPAAEAAQAAKRADYFAAGTLAVWDVDPRDAVIHCYFATAPDQPILFPLGSLANVGPVLPGWQVATAEVFA